MLNKKLIILWVAALACTMLASAAPGVSAGAAVLMDADSGRVLYAQNENTPMLIASTTKIMTALVVLENCQVSQQVMIPPEAENVEGSSLYLKAGERLSVQDLLYGLMLRSGNDAAVALAIHCSGSIEAFSDLMNQKARELGLTNCHFVNPNGLDAEGHMCSAYDLAVIACAAMEIPEFAQIVATKTYTFGQRTVTNHNKLLRLYPDAVGVKTGFTKKAGRTLVGAARRDGQLLIAVTLNDGNDWNDHMELFDYGFEAYPRRIIIQKGQLMTMIPVFTGVFGRVTAVASEELAYPLAEGEEYEIRLYVPAFVFAPVEGGRYLGKAQVLVEGQLIGEVLLEAGSAVNRLPEPEKGFLEKIMGE